jgi:GMP synthase (glutamine-hydrolysing)
MKSLIIKTGHTFHELKQSKGDFEDWIMRFWKHKEDFLIHDITRKRLRDIPASVRNIIITGSHSDVTDEEKWQENLIDFIHQAVQKGLPVLGICYGHQILAEALGGKVHDHPAGGEFGVAVIQKTDKAVHDPLFKELPNTFVGFVSHGQTVKQLPRGAQVLGKSTTEAYEAVRYKDQVWGVQFHPEFDPEITRFYLNYHHQNRPKGIFNNLDSVQFDIRYSQYILYNFFKLFM